MVALCQNQAVREEKNETNRKKTDRRKPTPFLILQKNIYVALST